MRVIITGGGGFIGNQVARELYRTRTLRLAGNPESITSLVLADRVISPSARTGFDRSVEFVEADLAEISTIRSLVRSEVRAIFHLAAMMSGDGEKDFDGCLRINLDGTRALLEQCRSLGTRPRLVFASSLAVFGGKEMPAIVSDRTKLFPQTTYGMTKAIGEFLINEYARRGFVDGRAARLPTVFIRPGRPNAAASSFASSLFREPLAGVECRLPVSRSQSVPLLGYRQVVENLIRLMECDATALGEDRVVTLPSTQYRVADMILALERVARRKGIVLGSITDCPDDAVAAIVATWPVGTNTVRATSLGLKADESLEQVIEDYCTDFPPKPV